MMDEYILYTFGVESCNWSVTQCAGQRSMGKKYPRNDSLGKFLSMSVALRFQYSPESDGK